MQPVVYLIAGHLRGQEESGDGGAGGERPRAQEHQGPVDAAAQCVRGVSEDRALGDTTLVVEDERDFGRSVATDRSLHPNRVSARALRERPPTSSATARR